MEPVKTAHRIENVHYAIRNIVGEAKKLEATGRQVLYCNVGDPLVFDFATPPHLVAAVHRAMLDGKNGYAPSAGLTEARTAIAADAQRRGLGEVTAQDVMITAGASEAIELTLTALFEPGESILLPSPGYPLYDAVAAKLSVEVIPYQLDESRGWALDLAEIESKVKPTTRAIVVCNPNNPTGGQYDRAGLLGLLEIARRHKLVVLSDEIYDRLTYDRAHVPTSSLATDVPIITFAGLSKAYLAPGWRVGWLIVNAEGATAGFRRVLQKLGEARLCSPGPVQHAVAPALEGPQGHIAEMMGRLRQRRDLVVKRINAIPGLSVVEPQGAFYAMARINLPKVTDDEAFIRELLHATGVLFVHGSGFGQKPGTQHFRIVFLPPPAVLEDAFDRLGKFVRERYA